MHKLIKAVFRECQNISCKFRFPDTISDEMEVPCPKCGANSKILYAVDLKKDHRKNIFQKPNAEIITLLDNVRSVYNVGAIFRTMNGFGLLKTILCGITPTPTHKNFHKTSLGAESFIQWNYEKNAFFTCEEYKSNGFQLISLESCESSLSVTNISKNDISDKALFIVGNEITGIDKDILKISDLILSIPIVGNNKSFNVTTAFGIGLFQLIIP